MAYKRCNATWKSKRIHNIRVVTSGELLLVYSRMVILYSYKKYSLEWDHVVSL